MVMIHNMSWVGVILQKTPLFLTCFLHPPGVPPWPWCHVENQAAPRWNDHLDPATVTDLGGTQLQAVQPPESTARWLCPWCYLLTLQPLTSPKNQGTHRCHCTSSTVLLTLVAITAFFKPICCLWLVITYNSIFFDGPLLVVTETIEPIVSHDQSRPYLTTVNHCEPMGNKCFFYNSRVWFNSQFEVWVTTINWWMH